MKMLLRDYSIAFHVGGKKWQHYLAPSFQWRQRTKYLLW